MAETRNGGGRGGGKKAKTKAPATRAAAETPAPSPSVTTRAAASGKKANKAAATPVEEAAPSPTLKAKAKAKAQAPAVPEVAAEPEAVPSRKKKKRKRVHKRKGSDAGALAAVGDEQRDETPEPPMKKQTVKKATDEGSSKKAAPATPSKTAPALVVAAAESPVESKNTRSRNRKKGKNGPETQEEVDAGEPETRRVQLSATVETPVSTPQRGRLTRAAAAAAAAVAAMSTPVKSTASASASDQSPPSSSKPKRKRKRSRQGRRESVEPTPAVDEQEDKQPTESSEEPKAATADFEEDKKPPGVALSPVKPKKTIISLVKVKASRLENEAAPSSISETDTKSEPAIGLQEEEEAKEEGGEEAMKSTSPKTSPLIRAADAELDEREESGVDQGEAVDETVSEAFNDALMAEPVVDADQDTEDEDMLEDAFDQKGEEVEPLNEDSDREVDEEMKDNESSDELEMQVSSIPMEADDGEAIDSELVQLATAAGDDDNHLETEDDESIGEAEEMDAREEQAVGGDGDAREEEAFEEDALDDEAYEDEADMQSAAVDFFMTQHPVEGPSADDTDSDDEQQQRVQSDASSESESGYLAQAAAFSDSDEEEEEEQYEDEEEAEEEQFQPGMGQFRFSSTSAGSNAQGDGSPEVIELSDSDSDSDGNAESDAEADFSTHTREREALEDQDEPDEQEEEEIDDEEDEDEEEARWYGERENDGDQVRGPNHSTVDHAASPETDHQLSETHVEAQSGFGGWEQQSAEFGDRKEEAKAEEDTEEEEELDDDSADDVVEVMSDDEDKEGDVDDEERASGDGDLTPSPLDAPQKEQREAKKPASPVLFTESDDHDEAVQPLTLPEFSVPTQDRGSVSTPQQISHASAATTKASDEAIPETTATNASADTAVETYTTVPSKLLLESVLAGSPRATVASLTQGAFPTPVPARSHSHSRTWGPSFGGASVDTNAPIVASSRQAEASPLSSWFFAKGPANFKKRVVMPRVKETSVYGLATPGSPRHRVGSPRPAKKARLDTETKEEEDSSASRTDEFVQRLLDTSSWRSWYNPGEANQLLDPPLPVAMIKRLGGEAALAMFNSPASDLTLPASEDAEVPKKRRHALSTLEEAIQEEKKRARAFDQELLRLLQGKTLAGKELADEFAPLLASGATN